MTSVWFNACAGFWSFTMPGFVMSGAGRFAVAERYIRPLVDTAETVDEIDECCRHLRDCLTYAEGEFLAMVREDLDALLERRLELSRA